MNDTWANDEQATDTQQIFTEMTNDLRLSSVQDANWAQQSLATLPAWITTPYEKHESDDAQSDLERVVGLECIIAILIEKNERMRQQLGKYMD